MADQCRQLMVQRALRQNYMEQRAGKGKSANEATKALWSPQEGSKNHTDKEKLLKHPRLQLGAQEGEHRQAAGREVNTQTKLGTSELEASAKGTGSERLPAGDSPKRQWGEKP